MSHFHISESTKLDKQVPDGYEVITEGAPKSYKVNPREIMIQVLHRPQEMIHPALLDASYTWVDQGCGFQRIADPFGGWIHVSRNWQSRMFLDRKEFKYLLILDADEGVPWWVPFALAEHDEPIISGVVCGFTAARGVFACVAVKTEQGRAHFPSLKETKTIPAKGLSTVHNAGTGCLMIRRDVLEKMWAKYDESPEFGQPFSIPEAEQNQAALQGAMPRGEDICFTDRARQLGYDVKVDWAVKLTHRKPFDLSWPDQALSQLKPAQWARCAFPKKKAG